MNNVVINAQDARADALVTRHDPASIIHLITRAASDPTVSIDKMERLFDMHRQMEERQAQTAFNAAMALAQAEIGPVFRSKSNNHTRSTYAALEDVDAAIRPIYTRHGFSLSFDTDDDGAGVKVNCDVLHSAGHTKRHSLRSVIDNVGMKGEKNKTDIQGLGSSVSYLRRYLTMMIFNVAMTNEDHDGNASKAPISAAQYEELTAKLEAVNADKAKFNQLFKIDSLADLPAGLFEEAIAAIEAKARKVAANA